MTDTGWWRDAYGAANRDVVEPFEKFERHIAGACVADIGCADGALVVAAAAAGAAEVVGFEEEPPDRDRVAQLARLNHVVEALPEGVRFEAIHPNGLPVGDAQFDVVFSYGALPRLRNLTTILRETRRTMKPDGVLYAEVGPLFLGPFGGWLASDVAPYDHLLLDGPAFETRIARAAGSPEHAVALIDRFRRLNRLTVDELQNALLGAGLQIEWTRITTTAMAIPPSLQHIAIHDLLTSAVTVVARPS